jgi:hypothetical protein
VAHGARRRCADLHARSRASRAHARALPPRPLPPHARVDGAQAYAVEKENLALVEHKSLVEEAEDLLLAGAARASKSKSA